MNAARAAARLTVRPTPIKTASAMWSPLVSRSTIGTTSAISATPSEATRIGPRRRIPYQPAARATAVQPSTASPRGNCWTNTYAARSRVAAPSTSAIKAAALRRPSDAPSWPSSMALIPYPAAECLDAEQLLLLRLEVVGADHALVPKLGELLELGGVVGPARCRLCGRRRRWRLLLVGGLVLRGPLLILVVPHPSRHPGSHADTSRSADQYRSSSHQWHVRSSFVFRRSPEPTRV